MKKLIIAFLSLLLISSVALANYYGVVARKNANYCSSLSWPILTDANFLLDVDNTDNDLYACIDSGTETGDADTAHCTPGTVSNGSGGQAICSGSGIIQYDNTGTYVDLRQGEIGGTIWIDQLAASGSVFLRAGATDYIDLRLNDGEALLIAIIDNGTAITSTELSVADEVNTYWVDFQCQWDYSRDTADEVTCRIRVQDGTPTWEAWSNSTDTDAMSDMSDNQPTTDEVDIGAIDNDHNIIIDDLEINNTLPDGWEP